jgi:hypothetical protein
MSRLDDASSSYDRFAKAKFRIHIVRDPLVESLWPICDEVRIALKDNEAEEDEVQRYKRPVFRLRQIAAGLPVPFDTEGLGLSSTSKHLKMLSDSGLGLLIGKALDRAATIAEQLLAQQENQLAAKLREIVRHDSTIAIQDSYWRPLVLKWLATEFPSFRNSVVTFKELKSQPSYSHLVFIGSPQLVSYRHFQESDFRFARDPRSLENDFVMYGFGNPSLDVKGLISEREPMRTITTSQPFVAHDSPDELDLESEWSSIERASKSQHPEDRDTEVMARFIGLAGNRHVYIEDDPRTSVFVLLRDQEGNLDVGKTGIRDLRTNTYLLLRTIGASSALIVEIADSLGAQKLRPSQKKYKDLLQQKIKDLGGVPQVRHVLHKQHNLETANVADWAFNPARIGPGSMDNFIKLCEFLGIPNEAEKLWKHLEKIRALHVKAGNEAVKRLKDSIKEVSPSDPNLRESGSITRSIPGCGEIGVYRVEHIGEPQLISIYEVQILRG